jgi:hypothetical protein
MPVKQQQEQTVMLIHTETSIQKKNREQDRQAHTSSYIHMCHSTTNSTHTHTEKKEREREKEFS